MEEEKQNNNPIENTNDKGASSSPTENNSEQQENTNDNSAINIEEIESTATSPKQGEVIIENEPDFFDKLGKKAIWLALGLAACIATYVYWDFLIFDRVLLYTDIGSDSVNIFYPWWAHYADLWREPGIPSWTMQWAMGQSVGYAGMPDPFFMIYILLGKSNIPYAIVYIELIKILLTVVFIFYYLNYFQLKKLTCIIGSLLFAFSGYMIMGTSGWPFHSEEVMFIALFLLVIEKYIKDKKWIWVITLSFILSWINTFLLLQLIIIGTAYCLFRNYENNKSIKNNLKSTLSYLVLYFGGMLLAFQIVKDSLIFIFKSGRAESMNSSEQVTQFKKTESFSLASGEEYDSIFYRMFSNDLMGTGSDFKGWFNYLESPILYIGLPVLIFIFALFNGSEKKQKNTYIFILGICLLLLIFPWFRYAFWGFNLNYFRSFGFYISILLFYLAMFGLNKFLIEKRNYKHLLFLVTGFLFLLFVYPGNASGKLEHGQRMFIGLLFLLYAGVVYFRQKVQNQIELKWGLLALVMIELGLQAHTTVNNRNTLSDADLKAGKLYGDSTLQVVNWLKKQDTSFYRIAKYYPSGPAQHMSMNDAMVQNFNGLIGYSSFHQKYYMRFLSGVDCIDPKQPDDIKWTYKILSRPYLSSFAGAKYFLDKDSIKLDTINFKIISKKYGIYIYESNIANSIAVAYEQYITEKEFKTLSKWNKDFVLYKSLVISDKNLKEVSGLKHFNLKDTISKDNITAFLSASKEQQALLKQNLKVTSNSINGFIETSKPCIISFLIPFDEKWKLELNGEAKNYFVGNLGFICFNLDKKAIIKLAY